MNSIGDVPGLAGRRVVVLAGSRGIGRAVVELFAAAEARVVAVARGEATLKELAASDGQGRIVPLAADLSEPGAAEQVVSRAADLLGGIDVLVNNVGGWSDRPGATGPLLKATHDAYTSVMDLNIRTTLFATLEAARLMIAQGTGGSICCTASIDGLFPAPGEGLYGAAKAAVVNLVGTLAYELGQHRIRVNAVAPAIIETDLTAEWLTGDDQRADRASLYPLRRFGQPDDVARTIVFLCSPAADWISGVTVPINGGQQATGNAFRWVRQHNPVPPDRKL
ncbi:NAD(P)-dependent dehydrogenase, short-chain alcohol dehydrogenase family [Streptosporangium canum]|uniref:NAD(P)-dependent dehydrogenase, short-chain alcohol dehydrogenase family n=1 Tax=Streptosporangium canum TaxID=324952 RepID=A0A1I3N188_9ACTN|nr:SDR family NAD(P)-dependent oxidoreductase [Streptosporangium canum]SFJ03028.1 NAD(P)-dependent dehydrogenase, short-chain alcohol dehydrogenase family [Streptosporangium canum]